MDKRITANGIHSFCCAISNTSVIELPHGPTTIPVYPTKCGTLACIEIIIRYSSWANKCWACSSCHIPFLLKSIANVIFSKGYISTFPNLIKCTSSTLNSIFPKLIITQSLWGDMVIFSMYNMFKTTFIICKSKYCSI